MGGGLQLGGQTQSDRRPDVMNRLAAIPYKDRTTAKVFAVMGEVGVQNQGAMYDYVVKSGLVPKESELYKEQKESANQLPLTPELLGLLKEQVPSFAADLPTQAKEPLGRVNVGAASMPLTPDILQGLVPDLRTAPIPGQPPQTLTGLPPEALFGAEAGALLQGIPQPPEQAQALPQIPTPGQTVPTTLVTKAAQAATKAPATKVPGFTENRQFIASFLYPETPPDKLSAVERKAISVYEETQKRAIARETGLGKIEAEQERPLDEDAIKWIDRETGKSPPPHMSPKEVKAAGYVPIDSKSFTLAQNAKAAIRQMSEYLELAQTLDFPHATGNIAQDILSVQTYRAKLALQAAGGDPNAKRLRGLFGTITTLARATGDAANIAVAERQFLREFVLTEAETYESAIAKLAQATRILVSIMKSGGDRIPDELQGMAEQLELMDLRRKKAEEQGRKQ